MISRRTFLRGTAAGALLWPLGSRIGAQAAPAEVLYNGITLGSPWPPRLQYPEEHPVLPPYLADPPAIIPIDTGRQLFVDDFLIEETSLDRVHHHATYHPANPIVKPDQPWELNDDYAERTHTEPNPSAMVFSDGVFYDPKDRLFKMWYMGGYGMNTCLATSSDGITWAKPAFDVVAGTNIVSKAARDSSTVWLDLESADPRQRYKMSLFNDNRLLLYTSPDGVHWLQVGSTGRTGDRSTFFYNPFRRVWVFSIRADQYIGSVSGRYRQYVEATDFAATRDWSRLAPVAWVKADSSDYARAGVAERPELYNLDCVAYESVMLGLFSIWRGESNQREKINEIAVGFSRDGFHWHRPDRSSFLSVSEEVGSWNWANVQSAGGGCVVVGDRLHFYVSGRQGRPGTGAPGVCSTGLATLRRDGFASMDWLPGEARTLRRGPVAAGTLITRPVTFSGGHLFVNADLTGGELRVEVLDRAGRVVAPFTATACIPVTGDGTRLGVSWSAGSLASLAGQPVRFRFTLTRGRLYAFWVSVWPTGQSRGYPAAGGPEFAGAVDAARA
ncbi:MAG: glycosyl hydrolase family 32 [Vicinamibacterales bacterium]